MLNFNTYIDEICKKGGQKLNALSKVTPYMDFSRRRMLINASFLPQFSYSSLVWMCHSHTKNNKTTRPHKRCLQLIYNDRQSSLHELVERNGSVSIQKCNLLFLAIEMFKIMKIKKIVLNCEIVLILQSELLTLSVVD